MDSNSNQIEEIKNRLDIAQVVEKYVKLKKTGKNYSGLCPFHTEKTPSFIVSPDLQRYKCFGCGENGDIFNFVQEIENIDFPEALERLAKQAGVELQKRAVNYKYKTLEEINYNATKYFYNELKKDNKASEYLKERGFSQESIKAFAIGYAPKNPELKKYIFKTKRYNKEELLDSGLFTEKNGVLKDKFYDRIMFPIRSKRGTVIAFTGRVLPDNKWGPKYMNSPETPIFHKKDNVFGQYESRQEIRKNDLVIMCEGSTDVISAHQHGFKNVVAPLGTSLTNEQLQSLSTMTKNFLFFFDSDEAGVNALIRAFKIASELKLNPYATDASPYKDIDELLQKEPAKMKKLIKGKKEAFSYILSNFCVDKNVTKLEDMDRIRNFTKSLLDSVKDSATRDLYIKKASRLLKADSMEEGGQTSNNGVTIGLHVNMADNKTLSHYIQYLLLLDKIRNKFLVTKEHITSEDLQKIYQTILENKELSKEKLFDKFQDDPVLQNTFENLVFNLSDVPTNQEEVKTELIGIIKRVKADYLKGKQKELTVKIAFTEENSNFKDSEKYLKELMEINKMLKEV